MKRSRPPACLTVTETAAHLNVSRPTIYKLASSGELPHTRVSALLRFRLCDLDDYLAARTTTAWLPGERTNRGAAEPNCAPAR